MTKKKFNIKKTMKKLASLTMALLMIISIQSVLNPVKAASDSEEALSSESQIEYYYIYSQADLKAAVNHKNACLFIMNDILMTGPLYIESSITIDLNYHSIFFENARDGITINCTNSKSNVYIINGTIVGAFDSDSAIRVKKFGTLNLCNANIYGGDCVYNDTRGGHAIFLDPNYRARIYLDNVWLYGGNGYYSDYSIYGCNNCEALGYYYSVDLLTVYSIGYGYTTFDGIPWNA